MQGDGGSEAAQLPERLRPRRRAPEVAPHEIFDQEAVQRDLAAIVEADQETAAKRLAAGARLRAALDHGRERIRARFEGDHRSGAQTARDLAWLTDRIVVSAFDFVAKGLFNLASPTTAEQICVAAVGGYGRGELAPFSDVDLLFLTPYKQTAWGESVIETMLYMLWDMKLKVGHATRSVDECLRRASGDFTIRTALLEKRYLAGSAALFETLDQRLWSELFERTGPQFVEAKLAERDARHERTGGSRYLLEPNVKESKGGLRDVQTLFWLAKYLYHADSAKELVAKGVFTSEEATRCRWAEAHLWTVRCGLHYLAGRAQEKLTFDLQFELAERFGYREVRGQRPVERFMKRYFLAAKAVGDLTGIFCAALEHQHKKSPPSFGGLLRYIAGGPKDGEEIAADGLTGAVMKDGRLAIADPSLFRRDPASILRFFNEALRREVAVHPTALREVDRSRRAIDEAARADPEARRLFLELITRSRDPIRALRMMSVTGYLGRFIPDFGRVVGQMQFNMYHHYTVDEHSLLAVEIFLKLASGALKQEHPIASEIAMGLGDRRIMVAALLLHDAGKGLPRDHSIEGEEIARRVCPELDMTPGETEKVAWLIRHHLAMSDVAQKRDLSEPKTVAAFAQLVRSPARLNLLFTLTACDIRAVGPGVWNGWKAQLLRQLYHETRALLTGQAQGVSRAQRVRAAQEAFQNALLARGAAPLAQGWGAAEWSGYMDRFTPPYWTAQPLETHLLHAELMGLSAPSAGGAPAFSGAPVGDEIRTRAQTSPGHAATEVAFCTQDHPGLFARMAGALALVGASVVDAHAFTTKDGVAINTFWVQDQEGGPYTDQARLETSVRRVLSGEVAPREALKARRKLRPREQPFTVEPSVNFDNAAADLTTMVEVNGRDRVGLLHDLARALAAENVNIVSAVIATYGEHVVDVFYVKDVFGMKITQPAKQRRIEQALLTAVEKSGPG